ncbi:YraN family protein [candidate division GN15 bacterium]|nr:YraN family protein [candidate division GN15 bacterium]
MVPAISIAAPSRRSRRSWTSMNSSPSDPEHPDRQQRIGRRYEDQAARFLEQHGFDILERNWRAGRKEVDIIARRASLLVFVEVKADLTGAFGHPAERVDRSKIRHLTEAAQRYLLEKQISGCDCRFDVITFADGKLEHYPDAFPAASD